MDLAIKPEWKLYPKGLPNRMIVPDQIALLRSDDRLALGRGRGGNHGGGAGYPGNAGVQHAGIGTGYDLRIVEIATSHQGRVATAG